MRFALVLFLAILSFGVRAAQAQVIVTGRLELSSGATGAPGGYVVEGFVDNFSINTSTTKTDGTFKIVKNLGIDPKLLRSGWVVCRQEGKYAHSPMTFQKKDSLYEADVLPLKLLSTTEAKYTPEQAIETIQVLVTVEAHLYKVGRIGTSQVNVIDALNVLEKFAVDKRRAIVDKLVFDSVPSEILDRFRPYLR